MREIRYRYNKEKYQFEAWLMDPDDPWLTPLLVGTYTEEQIYKSPLQPKDAVKRWEDAVHSGTGIKNG